VSDPAAPSPARHIDLHLHSTASDGLAEPEEVVRAAVSANLAALALTDHDTVDGIPVAQEAAREKGIELIPGVELSAYERDDEVHLLGLHLDDLDAMRDAMQVFRTARRSRAQDMVRRLNDLGVRITFEDVLEEAGDAAIGRPHVARAMVQNGWAMDLRDAFDRYLGAGRPACIEKRRLGIAEAIDLVHGCGGIAVLAHPGGLATHAYLVALAARGLDGVEVLHPSHSADDRTRLMALTTHLGLVASGGSDSHGGPDRGRVVGAMQVPRAWLDGQRERVGIVRRGSRGRVDA
jgi:predicted metal-dependent phosphoesterase TrpH